MIGDVQPGPASFPAGLPPAFNLCQIVPPVNVHFDGQMTVKRS
jgi:hypothetical protein